jgi:rare lipoprotein A
VRIPQAEFNSNFPALNWNPSSFNRGQRIHSEIASTASWYGVPDGFHGQRMANGEIFNAYGLTAAHRSLPFGTRLRVTNLNNGRSVVVRVADRGPFVGGRAIDLSQGAALRIGMISTGTAPVRIEIVR